MSDQFWKKLDYIFGTLLIGPLFGLIVLATNVEIRDLDLWLHLKTGWFIVQNGFVPGYDVLSCSIAGKPWINHEWLFQVIVYSVYDRWGADGLISMQVFVVTVTFLLLLFLCYRKEKQLLCVFLLLSVVLVYRSRFTIRPDIFSLLFLTLYFYILSWHLDKRRALYVLFVLQVIWTNMHGFFFLGPFIVLLSLITEWLKRHAPLPYQWNKVGRLTDLEYKNLRGIFLVILLACLINPLTFHGAWYPIKVLFQISNDSRIFFDYIQELRPSLTWGTLFTAHMLDYKILLLVSGLSFYLNRKRIDLGDLLIWMFFLFFSLVAIRNLVFFAFVACLVCMANFLDLTLKDITPFRFNQKKFGYLTSIILKIILSFWILNFTTTLSLNGYFDFDKLERKSEFGGINKRNYPYKAADFLMENNVQANFFNDFNSGAYLIGRCFPNIKVFIDGRTEVYGPQFFKRYLRIWNKGDTALFDQVTQQYHITGAFLNSLYREITKELLQHLYEDENWAMVYLNYDGVIFLKRVEDHKAVIDQFEIDLRSWEVEELDLQKIGSRFVVPYQHINRAYTLESLQFDDLALAEANAALKIYPAYALAYKLKGKIAGKREDYRKAFENFRMATLLDSNNPKNRFNLAMAYEKLKDFENAIKQYKILINKDPRSAKAYFRLARAYAKDRQYPEALEALKEAHQLQPKDVKDVLKLGDIIYEQKEYRFAKEVYQLALNVPKNLAITYYKLGLSLQALGSNEQAREAFQKGLELNPDHEELQKSLKNDSE